MLFECLCLNTKLEFVLSCNCAPSAHLYNDYIGRTLPIKDQNARTRID